MKDNPSFEEEIVLVFTVPLGSFLTPKGCKKGPRVFVLIRNDLKVFPFNYCKA